MKKSIILTFDLEYWYQAFSIQSSITGDEKDSIKDFVETILRLLKSANKTATFFVVGKVLDNEPEIIKQINQDGHEIAVHSLDHKPLWDKNPKIFDKEIKEISNKIENLINKKPIGHRAVSFSLDTKTNWALDILVKNDFKYDSSIFPFKFYKTLMPIFKDSLYGIKSKIFNPYKINLKNPIKKDKNSLLTEIPISIFHLGKLKLPLTGGIYIRIIPWFVFKTLLKIKLIKEPVCLHFHAFDFEAKTPNIKMSVLKKFIKYYNTKNTWNKLEYIVKNFKCVSIEKYLYENSIN